MSPGVTDCRRPLALRAASVVVALAVLAAAGACTRGSGGREPDPESGSTSAVAPSPTDTLGPAPNPAALADRLVSPRLANASLEVGSFGLQGCPEGRIQFQEGEWEKGPARVVMIVGAVGDVNADGVDDLIVGLTCNPIGVSGNDQGRVFAYSGAGLGLVGRIGTAFSEGGVMTQIVVADDGIVEIDRAVMEPFTPTSRIWRERWQWSVSSFALVDQVEMAHEDAPELEMAVIPTSVDLAPGAAPRTVRVTIHNRGSSAPTQPLWLSARSIVDLVLSADAIPGVLGRRKGQPEHVWSLIVRAPMPGEAVTVDLRLQATAAVPAAAGLVLEVNGNINTAASHPEPIHQVTVDLGAGT